MSYAGAVQALRGVSLSVPEGAVVAVLGNNGAGKSTLLRALSGTLAEHDGAITGGTIEFGGRALPRDDAAAIARSGLVQVPEGRRVFGNLTVEENLRAGGLAAPGQAGARAGAHVGRRAVPDPARTRVPAGRAAVGRRAADAGHRPGADGLAEGAAARRAVAGAGAEDRRARRRGHPRDQRPRRHRRAGRAERGDGPRGRRPRGRARGGRGRARGHGGGAGRERGGAGALPRRRARPPPRSRRGASRAPRSTLQVEGLCVRFGGLSALSRRVLHRRARLPARADRAQRRRQVDVPERALRRL